MATLTTADYRELRESVYRAGAGKEELKLLAGLPNEAKLLAMFQSQEDFLVANFATLKSGIDTALGITTTNALARKLVAGYLLWKIAHV